MKTLEQILESHREPQCLDGRDVSRLLDFIPIEHWKKFGAELKEGVDPTTVETKPLTRENVLEQLARDLDFAFEKAIDQRGLSAGMMYEVVRMWMWVLDDPLQDSDDYAQYGLPFFKAVALKYGLPNPIGTDSGREHKYATSY